MGVLSFSCLFIYLFPLTIEYGMFSKLFLIEPSKKMTAARFLSPTSLLKVSKNKIKPKKALIFVFLFYPLDQL